MSSDVLSDVLRAVRLTGAVYFDFELSSPWVAAAPPSRDIAQTVMPGAQRVIEYHLIARGSGWGQILGEEPRRLAGLRDRIVGQALAALHAEPAGAWTVERLARRVGVSRSVLAERFTEMAGHPPMQYLALWRMQLASRRLSDGGHVAEVAEAVG